MKIDIDGNEKQIIEQKRFLLKSNRHFTVEAVRTFRPGLASLRIAPEMAWCLYVLIKEGHPLYEKASQNTTDYDIILGDMIYPFFHEGCTFYHKNSDYIKIGCDYQHLGDEFIMSDIFSDEIPSVILEDMKDLYKFFEDYQDKTTEKRKVCSKACEYINRAYGSYFCNGQKNAPCVNLGDDCYYNDKTEEPKF